MKVATKRDNQKYEYNTQNFLLYSGMRYFNALPETVKYAPVNRFRMDCRSQIKPRHYEFPPIYNIFPLNIPTYTLV